MSPASACSSCSAVDSSFIDHEGRLGRLEEASSQSKGDRGDQWTAINALRSGQGEIKITSATTLQVVQQIMATVEKQSVDINSLTTAKAISDGERRRDAATIGVVSAALSGVATYFVSHFIAGGK